MSVQAPVVIQEPDLVIGKSPYVFLTLLVIIEFFFAMLPSAIAWILDAGATYESYDVARTVSYSLLAGLVMTKYIQTHLQQ